MGVVDRSVRRLVEQTPKLVVDHHLQKSNVVLSRGEIDNLNFH